MVILPEVEDELRDALRWNPALHHTDRATDQTIKVLLEASLDLES